tara:strand:+ start:9492 stop:10706 length:1215 start_codon:yes stop_codon:yes gene_type:complete
VATFKELTTNDIKTSKSFLNQLIEVVGEDISSSVSRRQYEHFVTGGASTGQPGVTSSLFHTIYDQDYTVQTANPIFDITFGLNPTGTIATASEVGTDANGKRLYPSGSLMMREKGFIYQQYAQLLLGDADSAFVSPLNSTTAGDRIDNALFINFKRLFARDQLKRGTLTLLMFKSGNIGPGGGEMEDMQTGDEYSLASTGSGQGTFTDSGADVNKLSTFGGGVGNIISGTAGDAVGLSFVDQGILVLDMERIFSGSQTLAGAIDSVHGTHASTKGFSNFTGSQKQFWVSASVDDVLKHICTTRFGSTTNTIMKFQNITNINSTLFFCRATADEFNYSSNPTFVNTDNEIQVIETGQEDVQQAFVFASSVGLYDANNNLLAVAKLSRPVEKNSEKDLTFRIRLDF